VSLRIEIRGTERAGASDGYRLQALLFNDSYEPVTISRNAFVGPNVRDGTMRPDAVEATFGGAEEPLTLQPFTFYGRERSYEGLAAGEATVEARYRDPNGGEEISASQPLQVT
jgi:hypothetical protein